MCDFSLQSIKSRPAKIGDKLTTRDFGTGTRGFSASEDATVAVCLRPGTELSFAGGVTFSATGLSGWWHKAINHKTAIFRQINKERVSAHHDALEFSRWSGRAADITEGGSTSDGSSIASGAHDGC
jgi:hypothetical protein